MISVCIATYNGEKYINKQLESILNQLNSNDEIIISDDGSTDKTLEIIGSYKDSRVKIFHHKKNERLLKMHAAPFRLAANNFENAITNSKGDYIYLSDQDDIWLPDRIEKTRSFLDDYDLVMCNYKVIDATDKILDEHFLKKNPINRLLLKNMLHTPFLGCSMAFRRNVLDYCLPFPRNCIGHDFWMGCMIVHLGKYKYIDEPLHSYRKHVDNVSPATGKSQNSIWFKLIYRMDFLWQVMIRSSKCKKFMYKSVSLQKKKSKVLNQTW